MKLIPFLLRLHYKIKIGMAGWNKLEYGNPSFNPKTGVYSLDCRNKIKDFLPLVLKKDKENHTTAYLYLIIEGKQNNVLYVGVDNDAHLRLTQHLVKSDNFEGKEYGKPSSTDSQIKKCL